MHRLFFRPIFFAFAAYAVIDARRVKRCRQAQGALPLERMALHKRSPEVSCCRGFKSLLYFLHGRRKGPCRWSVCFPAVNLWASTHSQWPARQCNLSSWYPPTSLTHPPPSAQRRSLQIVANRLGAKTLNFCGPSPRFCRLNLRAGPGRAGRNPQIHQFEGIIVNV